jgi:hypothetical protein
VSYLQASEHNKKKELHEADGRSTHQEICCISRTAEIFLMVRHDPEPAEASPHRGTRFKQYPYYATLLKVSSKCPHRFLKVYRLSQVQSISKFRAVP